MSPDALSLLFAGVGFVVLIVSVAVASGVILARAGKAPERSQIADVLQATAALEARYRDEHAKREQAEWERNEERAERARLNKENASYLLRMQEAEHRANDANRRADREQDARKDAEQRAVDAERAVKNGLDLFNRLEMQQREMVLMKKQLQVALARINELEKQQASRA